MASLKQHVTRDTEEPSTRDLFSPPTFRAGQRAFYIDAYKRLCRCTVTRDEGERGRVYVRLDWRGTEVWFDRHERDRLMVSTSEKTEAQP